MPRGRELEKQYRAALQGFLKSDTEQNLEKAYGVGRKAIADGYGVLQVAAVFQKVLDGVLEKAAATKRTGKTVERALVFFCESLSPFEMTLRGFSENNEKLQASLQQLTTAQTELERQN